MFFIPMGKKDSLSNLDFYDPVFLQLEHAEEGAGMGIAALALKLNLGDVIGTCHCENQT